MESPLKSLLTDLGKRLSARSISNLNAVVNYLEIGRWMHAQGFNTLHRFGNREQLWGAIAGQVGAKEVLYLEFGVYTGNATRYWSKHLRHPNSKLHGFDSFEGLPGHFIAGREEGYFSVRGKVPTIDDPRAYGSLRDGSKRLFRLTL